MKNLNELELELKAIELQLQQVKGDRDLENSLKKQRWELFPYTIVRENVNIQFI